MAEKHPQYINSVARALQILELYAQTGKSRLGISEIASELGIQKTSAFNIVKTLAACGWLIQETQNGKYRLGTKILRVSSAAVRTLSANELISIEMRRIRDLFNEDVVLTAPINGMPVCVEKVQSENSLRITSVVGRINDFLRGSTGKTLFAWQPEVFINRFLEETLPDDKKSQAEIKATLKNIRKQGYCITVSELDPGVASITFPILGKDGYASYSLGVVGEENRMERKCFRTAIRDELKNSVQRIEETLYFMS